VEHETRGKGVADGLDQVAAAAEPAGERLERE
jgi:hypothetical protein